MNFRFGSLFFRFLIPVLGVLICALLYARFIWAPGLTQQALDNAEIEVQSSLHIVSEGLVPMLIQRDLSNIYDTLDEILEDNPRWLEIGLYNERGISLYPLLVPSPPEEGSGVTLYSQEIRVDEFPIGYLELYYDTRSIEASVQTKTDSIFYTLVTVIVLVALMTALAFYLLVHKRLHRLTVAVDALSDGDFEYPILSRGNDEIGHLSERFGYMRTQLQEEKQNLEEALSLAHQASRAKGEFLANMSHEIRTPMNGVLGMLQLLHQNPLPDEQQERVKLALSSANSLITVINDILDFSKVEAGKLQIEAVDFDLVAQLEEMCSQQKPAIQAKGLSYSVDLDGIQHRFVNGDPYRMRQVISNLVGNSLKFTHQGGIFATFATRLNENGSVELQGSIEDTGIGIAPERQAEIFDSFSQADASTTREYGGTGLGLAICKQLCDLMGGRIELHSQPGQGTRVDINFTLNPGEQPQEVTAAKPEEPEIGVCQVLLVEDNKVNQVLAVALLKRLGCVVTTAENGQKALEILRAQPSEQLFHLVLMDCQMPVMDGYETTKNIRAGQGGSEYQSVPIIAMTANSMKGDAEKCLAAGMDDYLSKPLDFVLFKETIQRWSGAIQP
ncbi:ATP-binding protein [Marinobacterium mangrovicola]|uniref:histidine kinase n=1 Tax=Marinobacterium mangrovicola TaxID=1476959 RepID=A0A4R1GJW6_9GAMM|nr:ATP-binding protein [Marinobacterium mangrovicola]TCK08687.1 signal transduction histidine kinase [Marinobacterium mangrovicola]